MFDALTAWFKSVFSHAPALLRGADLAAEQWDDVPLPRSAAPWRQPAIANDDGDWDAVIARAKMRAASPPPLRTPPPSPSPRRPPPPPDGRPMAPHARAPLVMRPQPDTVIRKGPKRSVPPSPSCAVSQPADEDWGAAIRRAKAQQPERLAPSPLTRR
jgi:hypothetical protein